MRSRRNRQRRGRYLPSMDVLPLVERDRHLRTLHELLTADGYTLQTRRRFYVGSSGMVTLRFVWRCRRNGRCAHFEEIRHIDHEAALATLPAQAMPASLMNS